MHLGHLDMSTSPLFRSEPEAEEVAEYYERVKRVWLRVAGGIETMHAAGVTCGDLSLTNVIVRDGTDDDIRMIDFEAAWDAGVDAPTDLYTPGFGARSGHT